VGLSRVWPPPRDWSASLRARGRCSSRRGIRLLLARGLWGRLLRSPKRQSCGGKNKECGGLEFARGLGDCHVAGCCGFGVDFSYTTVVFSLEYRTRSFEAEVFLEYSCALSVAGIHPSTLFLLFKSRRLQNMSQDLAQSTIVRYLSYSLSCTSRGVCCVARILHASPSSRGPYGYISKI
jgi:hypothetical protein